MNQKRDLTQGPVGFHLFRLGAPMTVAVAAILSVSLADTYFLGQLGTAELAAISFTFPVVLSVNSLGIGLSAGASSVVSRAIGGRGAGDVRRLATDSLILGFFMVSLISVAGWFAARPLFALIGAEGGVLDMVTRYMQVYFLGVPLLVVPMVAMGLIRASGDTTAPSAVMVIGSLINIALDPVFIFGWGPVPALSVEGAAWAALLSRVVIFVAAMAIVIFREQLITWAMPTMAEFARSVGAVTRVGIPAAGSNMINPISMAVVTGLLATYGNEAVAAFGVATRVETMTTIPMLALSSAIGPVVGQNWGRGDHQRSRRAMALAFWFVLLSGLVLGGSFFLLGERLVALFTDDSVVGNLAFLYLVIVGVTLGGYGVVINASAAYNALGKPLYGLGFTLLRSWVFYIPAVAFAVTLGGTWPAFAAIGLTNIVSGLIVAIAAFGLIRRA